MVGIIADGGGGGHVEVWGSGECGAHMEKRKSM